MTSLQTLVFMVHFQQATFNLNSCYSLIGIALRSALSMGLHRNLPNAKISAVEDETRKRVFHVIRQLDCYLSTVLGSPILLQGDDIDQPLPTEADDEYITRQGILFPPSDMPNSVFEAFNAHARLMDILDKVVKHVYPTRRPEEGNPDVESATYTVKYTEITSIDQELKEWYEKLPMRWRPGSEASGEVKRQVRGAARRGVLPEHRSPPHPPSPMG
jgi:hypothetical protein